MLTGFGNETHELTEQERDLLPYIVMALRQRTGRSMAVTNREMCRGLLEHFGITITEPRIRKIINYIRSTNQIKGLIATSDGYYISRDLQEVKQYVDSLQGRETAIAAIKKQMCQYLQQLANVRPDEICEFIDEQIAPIYLYCRQKVKPEHMPPYTRGFLAGISAAIATNNFYSFAVKQSPQFVQALHDYFLSVDDEQRADILYCQVQRCHDMFSDMKKGADQ